MKNLHKINNLLLTDKELAAVWHIQQNTSFLSHIKFTYINGRLHDNGNGNNIDRIVEEVWDFQHGVLDRWIKSGKPLPDLSVIKIK